MGINGRALFKKVNNINSLKSMKIWRMEGKGKLFSE